MLGRGQESESQKLFSDQGLRVMKKHIFICQQFPIARRSSEAQGLTHEDKTWSRIMVLWQEFYELLVASVVGFLSEDLQILGCFSVRG